MKIKYFVAVSLFFFISTFIFANNKIIRAGYIDSNKSFMNGSSELDSRSGYGYDYLIQISNFTDWKYNYSYGSWQKLYNELLEGSIDILIDVPLSKYDESKMLLSRVPVGIETYYIYQFNEFSSAVERTLEYINGKTIGIYKDNTSTNLLYEWIRSNELLCKVVIYDDKDKYIADYENGVIDYIFDSNVKNELPSVPVIKVISEDYYIAIQKSKPEIKSKIDEALAMIKMEIPDYEQNLYKKYYVTDASNKFLLIDEQQWLEDHEVLKIGCLKNYLPYCGMDVTSGNVIGLLPDLMEKILVDYNLLSKVHLQYVFYDREEDGILGIDSGEIDMFFPAYQASWYAEMYNWYQTVPFAQSTEKLVFKDEFSSDKYKKIAVVSNTPDFFYARMKLPESEVEIYKSIEAALNAVMKGSVDSALVNGYMLHHCLQNRRRYDRLTVLDFSDNCNYAAIMSKDHKEFYHFMNRALNAVDDRFLSETESFYASEVFRYTLSNFIKDNSKFIAFIIIFLIFTFLLLIFSLRRLNAYSDFDDLTHLLSEKKIKPTMREAIEHAMETEDHFCVIVSYVNEYTNLTNTYGNSCGEEILKYISSVFLRGVKRDDFVFRYKGNKILVILNNTLAVAESVMNRITSEIESEVFVFRDSEIKITMTTGYSDYADGATVKMMLEEAEVKLN